MVEIYTTMDNGVDFAIERLHRGSVINHRSFITEDKIDVNARCQMPVTLFYILWDRMSQIKEECGYDVRAESLKEELIRKKLMQGDSGGKSPHAASLGQATRP